MRWSRALIVGSSMLAVVALGLPAQASDDPAPDPAIFGRVLTGASQPVAGAQVVVRTGSSIAASTTTSSTGAYSIDVPDGTYSLEVTAADSSLGGVRTLAVAAPRDWPLDLVLAPRTAGRIFLTGDLTLSDGTAFTSGGALFAGAGNPVSSSGFFSTATLPGTTGTWSISAARATTGPDSSLVLFARGGPQVTALQDTYTDVVVPSTRTRIVVTDAQGAPVAQATIRLNSGGFGQGPSRAALIAGMTPFTVEWTASARTSSAGIAEFTRPALIDPAAVTLMVDPTPGTLLPHSSTPTLPATDGQISVTLQPRATPTPTPSASAAPAPSPSTTASPSASVTSSPTIAPSVAPTSTSTAAPTPMPTLITTIGRVVLSDGTLTPGATVIPRDPSATVNGGNPADAQGVYTLTKPSGFTGTWMISTRPQASLAVPDPLAFGLSGGDLRTWTSDQRVDFTIPMQLHRVRVIDEAGQPVIGVALTASVPGRTPADTAVVDVLPGQSSMRGWWRGTDVTGPDGWAQLPAVTMTSATPITLTVAADPTSRYEGRSIAVAPGELTDTVLVLGLRAPTVSSVSPTRVEPGGRITITGRHLLGASSVTIGGVTADHTVSSDTSISVDVPADAVTGPVQVTTAGGIATSAATVTVLPAPLSITTASLPDGQVGQTYTATLQASGGVAPYTWRIYGTRPSGLALSSTGMWSGTPLRAMTQSITVAVTDATGRRVIRALPVTIAPLPLTAPGAIVAVTGRGSDQRISLSWGRPDDGGNPITGYRIEASTDDGVTWQTVIANTRSRNLGTSFAYPVATPSRFRVAAINVVGVGAVGDLSISPTLSAYGPPAAPAAITVTPSSGALRITWGAPSSDGGTRITGYRVRMSLDGTRWSTLSTNTRSTVTELVSRQRAGRNYWIQIAAINTSGLSPYTTSGPAYLTP